MARVLVVADDLTGANATGARFARAGLAAVTVADTEGVAEFAGRYDVVVADTASRHLDPRVAAERVGQVVAAGWPVDLVVKRTDTTLRGNVGAEVAAALQAVRDRAGDSVVALMAPAFPASGRATVGGVQLLDGAPLERTELARDPRHPMSTSVVEDILRGQAPLAVARVDIATVARGGAELHDALAGALAARPDVVLVDALTDGHLAGVADAAAALAATPGGPRWLSVDPGPFGALLAGALGITGSARPAPVLVVSGSATQVTRRQLADLVAHRPVRVVHAPVGDLAEAGEAALDALTARTAEALAAPDVAVVVLATATDAEHVQPVGPALGERIPARLARIVRRVLEDHPVGGLYTTGGDVTSAVLDALGARGLEVEDEVLPLAVLGNLVAGPYDGMPIATKGGLVGGEDATRRCVARLEEAARARRSRVRAPLPTTA